MRTTRRCFPPPWSVEEQDATLLSKLEQRLGGRLYAKQRLGIETDHEAQIFGQGLTFCRGTIITSQNAQIIFQSDKYLFKTAHRAIIHVRLVRHLDLKEMPIDFRRVR
jgi:hypothetical protein